MKKKGLLIAAFLVAVFFSSCDYRTCPTYSKKPASFEELQKMNDEYRAKLRTERKRV